MGFTLLPADGADDHGGGGLGTGQQRWHAEWQPGLGDAGGGDARVRGFQWGSERAADRPKRAQYDVHFDLAALQSKTILRPGQGSDRDAALHAGWHGDFGRVGEDRPWQRLANPFIDAGNRSAALPDAALKKTSADRDGCAAGWPEHRGYHRVHDRARQQGVLPLGNTVLIDAPPASLAYVANSTTLDNNPIPDSATGTPFPLDSPGYTIPVILRGGRVF